jgi:hypothetical protein
MSKTTNILRTRKVRRALRGHNVIVSTRWSDHGTDIFFCQPRPDMIHVRHVVALLSDKFGREAVRMDVAGFVTVLHDVGVN